MSEAPYLFLFGYLAVLVIALLLFKRVGLSLLEPSIPMLFIISYLIFSYLGAPFLVLGWDREALALGANDPSLTLAAWGYSGLTLLMMGLGFVYARFVLRFWPQRPSSAPNENWEISLIRVGLVVLICLVALWLYVRAVQTIPLLALFQGEGTDRLAQYRSSATNAFRQSWHYLIFTDHILPFVSYVLLSAYLMRKRLGYLAGFLLVAGIASFSSTMNLLRSGLVLYLASLVFLYYVTRRKPISLRTSLLYSTMAGVIIIRLIIAISRTNQLSAIEGAIDRIFNGYFITSYYYLKIFPVYHDFLWGQSFPNPGNLLPFQNFPLTVFVSQVIFGLRPDLVGSAPAPFWAEMYANFGPVGVWIVPFVWGVILWSLHVWATRWPRSPIFNGLITYLAFYIRPTSTSSLSSLLVPVEVVAVLIVAVFLQAKVKRRTRPVTIFVGKHEISFSSKVL